MDLSAFDRNLAQVEALARASGKRVRLATKSIRVPALIRRALEKGNAHGETFRGLMCFSAEEALALAREPWLDPKHDLLVAYPTVQPSDLDALSEAARGGRKIRLVIDDLGQLDLIEAHYAGSVPPFELTLEVDASLRLFGGAAHLGVRRSPVRTLEQAARLFDAVSRRGKSKITGLMTYEAQVAGLGDRNPFKKMLNPAIAIVRRWSMRRLRRLRRELQEGLSARGFAIELFNGGGSGSFNWAAREPWLTELTMGSGLLCPHLFDYYSNIRFEPAVAFALQAVRRSDPGFITCQGGGYIASGEPGWDRVPRPVFPRGLALLSAEGCGEVQTPLRDADAQAKIGAAVLFRHAKAGELFERFNEIYLLDQRDGLESVPTYRGRGWCFF